jgi:hypothetical protein
MASSKVRCGRRDLPAVVAPSASTTVTFLVAPQLESTRGARHAGPKEACCDETPLIDPVRLELAIVSPFWIYLPRIRLLVQTGGPATRMSCRGPFNELTISLARSHGQEHFRPAEPSERQPRCHQSRDDHADGGMRLWRHAGAGSRD